MSSKVRCLAIVLGTAFAVPACGQRSQPQPQTRLQTAPLAPPVSRSSVQQSDSRKQFVFRGTVEKVNARGGTLDVRNDNIPGWMAPMSMTYHVDAPAVLGTLAGGDRITATVYQGETSRLYQVRVAAPATKRTDSALPPISYVCPSPGEESFIDDRPGICPKSGAELNAVRLDIAYKCLRTSYIGEKPGTCPMDHTDLVPVTASIFWLCKDDPNPGKRYLEPGVCRAGAPREKAFEVRPHGDHNPRHGGPSVFMSEDLYHHVEATLVAPTKRGPAVFRVYFYDEYTRPIRATGVSAHVALTDSSGTAIGTPIPLVQSSIRDGNAMEVRMPDVPAPSQRAPAFFALHVKLKPTDRDWVTNHTFTSYSQEPAPVRSGPATLRADRSAPPSPSTASVQNPASISAAAQAAPASADAVANGRAPADPGVGGPSTTGVSGGVNPGGSGPSGMVVAPLPETTQGLVAELQKNMDSVTREWQAGHLNAVWYPALRAKDVALKLQEDHDSDVTALKQPELTSAVKQVTLSAWQIDSAGDLGNKEKMAVLYDVFHAAAEEILGLYGASH